jgi:hypothetical protein
VKSTEELAVKLYEMYGRRLKAFEDDEYRTKWLADTKLLQEWLGSDEATDNANCPRERALNPVGQPKEPSHDFDA